METLDFAIPKAKFPLGRIVITFNLRDYNRLIRRGVAGRKAGLIGFIHCHHVEGLRRVQDFIVAIEHEHAHMGARAEGEDKRLIVQISTTKLTILR